MNSINLMPEAFKHEIQQSKYKIGFFGWKPHRRIMPGKKSYHFVRVIANNKYVIYEPFHSYIVWIGFSIAFEMYFRTIQNWWISQLWWWIKIAVCGSHTAVNRKLHFGRILNLQQQEKKSINGEINFERTVHEFPRRHSEARAKACPLKCFQLCLKPKKILLNHNRLG